jgi:regulator of protease activity HflC (stomatin/prohibitin superfamily)
MPIDAFLTGTNIALVVLAVAIGVLVVKGIKIVPQGQEWTVERFGRYVRTLPPGLGLINPLFSKVGRRINMMENVLDVPEQDVITRDNASVTVDAIVFYQVVDARRAAYEVRELERALTNLALTNIRSRRHEPQDLAHHGRSDRSLGHQDYPGRDQGYFTSAGSAGRHGRADEGRA